MCLDHPIKIQTYIDKMKAISNKFINEKIRIIA